MDRRLLLSPGEAGILSACRRDDSCTCVLNMYGRGAFACGGTRGDTKPAHSSNGTKSEGKSWRKILRVVASKAAKQTLRPFKSFVGLQGLLWSPVAALIDWADARTAYLALFAVRHHAAVDAGV